MLGVRLKTWVKTHLGRERNQGHHQRSVAMASSASIGAPFTKPSALYDHREQIQNLSMMVNVSNIDKSTSSSSSTGLVLNGSTLVSSPDTGYSTDGLGLSNSNLLNHGHAAGAGANSPSSINTASTPVSLNQNQYATSSAKKREWFLQSTSPSNPNPTSFQFQDVTGLKLPTPKPMRIQTNPWYNPKSKRLSKSSADSGVTQDNHNDHDHDEQHQHPRHSTITADSGEGSYDSQKSSPRVSFSTSSSLESYTRKPDRHAQSTSTANRQKSVHHDDEILAQVQHNTKSPYKGWYQPQIPIHIQPPAQQPLPYDSNTLLSSKLSSFTPYFVQQPAHTPKQRKKQETLSPNESRSSGSKRRPFGFLKKLFRKGSSSKKGKNNSHDGHDGVGGAEVSLHDLYYHQNPIPAPAGNVKSSSAATATAVSRASPYFFTELQQPPPPSVPPRISSFLTPTPNAFRRRTVSDASTSMSMSVSMARRNIGSNLGYREPLQHPPAFVNPGVSRTPVLLSRESQWKYRAVHKTENQNHQNHGHGSRGHDLEYDDNYKIHNAYNAGGAEPGMGTGPKLSSVYCTPSRQQNSGSASSAYASYYSSPPQNSRLHGQLECSPLLTRTHTHVVGPMHTNSPIFHGFHQEGFVAVNQTPSKLPPPPLQPQHIVNRKLILQSSASPTPFTNNSSYSPIHRVAVLKGNTNPGNGTTAPKANFGYTNPSINVGFNGASQAQSLTRPPGRPEYFSPQQNHSSKYQHHSHVLGQSYNNNPSLHRPHHPSASFAFFSPQPQPASMAAMRSDPRRRCFQYISSSNQNSPILNTRQSQTSKSKAQQQILFNRLSPILRAPAAFANHHRVYPIKEYSPMPLASMGPSTSSGSKLVQDYLLSSSSASSSSTRSPAINVRKSCNANARTSPAAAIDKIYEEIDDDGEEDDDDDDEDDLTTAATVPEDETNDNPTADEHEDGSGSGTCNSNSNSHGHKLQTASQSHSHSDEGDGLGGDYYQCDYDSSLLSTTEELDETSHSHSQDQPSTASTSTLLKMSDQLQRDAQSQSQLQPFSNAAEYAIADKRRGAGSPSIDAAVAAATSVDISPTTRQLLEIENDLRFCRLIAEAQTLLRELESTATCTLARNTGAGLETYHAQRRFSGSSTSFGTSTSNNGNSNNGNGRNQRSGSFSGGGGSRVEECCPQSDPLRRKAYECWALRRLQQELAGCCASPLAFRHNLAHRQPFLQSAMAAPVPMQMRQNTNTSTRRLSPAHVGTNL